MYVGYCNNLKFFYFFVYEEDSFLYDKKFYFYYLMIGYWLIRGSYMEGYK